MLSLVQNLQNLALFLGQVTSRGCYKLIKMLLQLIKQLGDPVGQSSWPRSFGISMEEAAEINGGDEAAHEKRNQDLAVLWGCHGRASRIG